MDKRRILEVSKTLFNEKGYHNTSMRDISGALHISVGNLTYHYKKKEDILKELCDLDFYSGRKNYDENITLQELDEFLDGMMKTVIEHKFFFCDPQIVENLPEEIVEKTDERINQVMDSFKKYLLYLSNQKILLLQQDIHSAISEILMFSHIGWIQSRNDIPYHQMMYMQWILIKQFVSDSYQKDVDAILSKYQIGK